MAKEEEDGRRSFETNPDLTMLIIVRNKPHQVHASSCIAYFKKLRGRRGQKEGVQMSQ